MGDLTNYAYISLTADENRDGFADPAIAVGTPECSNVERLIDIQPTGEVNFCVDLPDGSLGNVHEASIAEIWNGDRARRFRQRRRQSRLASTHAGDASPGTLRIYATDRGARAPLADRGRRGR